MVKVRLFATLREKAGTDEIVTQLGGVTDVATLLESLTETYPELSRAVAAIKPRIAVNQEFVEYDHPVIDGDEVALIPPVSGGSAGSGVSPSAQDRAEELVRIQREDFSVDATIADVKKTSNTIGGISVFLGTARDLSKGKDISQLEFEHYPGMAEAKLREIRERALADYDIIEVSILHRFGAISIGENIVLIVVAAAHRDQAFVACRFCIDELKEITPIWKKEITPSGDWWVEEHP